MKYVVLSVTTGKGDAAMVREVPFVFGNNQTHSQVAFYMATMLRDEHKGSVVVPVSAGEFSSMDFDADCGGKSASMGGLKSRGEKDKRLIMLNDYNHGLV